MAISSTRTHLIRFLFFWRILSQRCFVPTSLSDMDLIYYDFVVLTFIRVSILLSDLIINAWRGKSLNQGHFTST